MKQADYEKLKSDIESGKVANFGGRTASSVAELDILRDLPDTEDEGAVIVRSFDHGKPANTDAIQMVDSAGQNSKAFTPEYVAGTRPDANEAGPTTVSLSDAPVKPDPRIAELEGERDKVKEQARTTLLQLESRHNAAIEKLRTDHATELTGIRAVHVDELNQVKAGAATAKQSSDREIDRLKKELAEAKKGKPADAAKTGEGSTPPSGA